MIAAKALSTSASSIRETISKLGMAASFVSKEISIRYSVPGGFSLRPSAKGGCSRCEPGFGRDRRAPIERGAGLRIVDLQRKGQPREQWPKHRNLAKHGQYGLRDSEEPGGPVQSGGEEADQLGCRQVGRVARQHYLPGRAEMQTRAADEIDEVVDEDEAAAVVDPGERQWQAARDDSDQCPKICLDAGTVDKGRTENDDLDPGFM